MHSIYLSATSGLGSASAMARHATVLRASRWASVSSWVPPVQAAASTAVHNAMDINIFFIVLSVF